MDRKTHLTIWYVGLALLAIVWLRDTWLVAREVETLAYSEFQQQLQEGKIAEISILDNRITGTFKQPGPEGRPRFTTTRVDPQLARDLAQHAVKSTGVVENTFLRDVLSWVIPALIFFWL